MSGQGKYLFSLGAAAQRENKGMWLQRCEAGAALRVCWCVVQDAMLELCWESSEGSLELFAVVEFSVP